MVPTIMELKDFKECQKEGSHAAKAVMQPKLNLGVLKTLD